jgi:hypothetical protein
MDVTTVSQAPWRIYPAAALALFGLALLAKGLSFGLAGSKGLPREWDALLWMRGFRLAVVGLCCVGLGIAWAEQVFWLFVASLGILGEELLETSVIIELLKRSPSARPMGLSESTAGIETDIWRPKPMSRVAESDSSIAREAVPVSLTESW